MRRTEDSVQQTAERGHAQQFYLDPQAEADLAGIMTAKGMRPKVDKSRVVREALRTVAEALGVPALRTTIGDVAKLKSDADRLKSAMARHPGLSQTALARQLGYDGHSMVSLVARSRATLTGALLTWVEQQEAGGVAP